MNKIGNEFVLEKETHDLILNNYAGKVWLSLKYYNVNIDFNEAKKLVNYESILNKVVNSTGSLKVNEGAKLEKSLSEKEKKEILNNAKNELKKISLIKSKVYLGSG